MRLCQAVDGAVQRAMPVPSIYSSASPWVGSQPCGAKYPGFCADSKGVYADDLWSILKGPSFGTGRGPPAWEREGRARCRVHRHATCLLVPEHVPGTTRTATKDRDPPCATAQFGRCTRLGGDGGRRTQSTIGRSVWKMPSSGTRRSSGEPLERSVLLCSRLRPTVECNMLSRCLSLAGPHRTSSARTGPVL